MQGKKNAKARSKTLSFSKTASLFKRQLTQKNQQAHVFLEDLVAAMPGNIYWLDKNNVYLGCNEEHARFAGVKSARNIIGKTNKDLIWRKQADFLNKINDKVMRSGKSIILEEAGLTAEGQRIYLTKKSPLYGADGKVMGLAGVSVDITEKKKLEKKLSEALAKLQLANRKLKHEEKKHFDFIARLGKEVCGANTKNLSVEDQVTYVRDYLENIIAQMPGHVYWLDKNNMYLGCNDLQAEHANLKSRHEIVGKKNRDFPWQKQAEELDRNNLEVMNAEKTITFEEFAVMTDGPKTYLTKKVPLKDKDGAVIGLLGISFDITERKQMEAELKKAKEEAEAASTAKTEFMLNMQHDLRTPLSHVVGLADILCRNSAGTVRPEKEQRYLQSIRLSAIRLADLIEEILKFSDVESGRVPATTIQFNLNEVTNKVAELASAVVAEKELELIIDHDDNIPATLIGDEPRLYRILLNLTNNAFKFTDAGHVKIATKLLEKKEDTVLVQIEVEDTGIGVPADKLDFIFERFSRLHLSNKNQYKGLGLGLWITKQFVKDLGGEIKVESELGKGTKFTTVLPFKCGVASAGNTI